jgi:hypothetical protein
MREARFMSSGLENMDSSSGLTFSGAPLSSWELAMMQNEEFTTRSGFLKIL